MIIRSNDFKITIKPDNQNVFKMSNGNDNQLRFSIQISLLNNNN